MTSKYDAHQMAHKLSDTQGLWTVLVSNGSGLKSVDVAGTQATAWTWAEMAAQHGAFGPGAWHPIDIALAGAAGAAFQAVAESK